MRQMRDKRDHPLMHLLQRLLTQVSLRELPLREILEVLQPLQARLIFQLKSLRNKRLLLR